LKIERAQIAIGRQTENVISVTLNDKIISGFKTVKQSTPVFSFFAKGQKMFVLLRKGGRRHASQL
jgi:hypothetical protein